MPKDNNNKKINPSFHLQNTHNSFTPWKAGKQLLKYQVEMVIPEMFHVFLERKKMP